MQLESLVSDIEQDLYTCGSNEIPSGKIGEQVMERLAAIDEVAYVRFASVYRRFKDITGFERELSHIKQKKSSDELVKER
jgi:transcriptional repressor NrdR